MTIIEPNQEPSPTTAPAPGTPKSSGPRRQMLIAWLVLILIVVIVVVGTSPFWAPEFAPVLPWAQQSSVLDSGTTTEISHLQARLDAADAAASLQATRLARLEAGVSALKQQAEQISQLQDRLSQLESRPTTTTTQAAPATAPPTQNPQIAAVVKALQDQVTKLSANTSSTADEIATLQTAIQKVATTNSAQRASLLALANLRIAVESSAPFTAELAAAQALAGNDTALKDGLMSLDGAAKTGLPTTAALAERFDRTVAPAILRMPRDNADADWWQRIKARIARLVVIRHVGPGGAEPRDATEAAVTKANSALKAGDLAAAAAALDNLSGAQAKVAATWLDQAKQRVAAEATLAKLWQSQTAKAEARP